MNKEDLIKYKEKLAKLTPEERKQRDLYLKRLGPRPDTSTLTPEKMSELTKNIPEEEQIQGPTTMYASIDKPWLYKYKDEEILSKVDNNSFYGFLFENCKNHLEEVAFNFEGNKIKKIDMFQNICRVEDMLKNDFGIKSGDMVSIAPLNQPESVYFIYALNKIGARVSIIDPRANSFTMKNDLMETNPKPKLFISSATAKKQYDEIRNEVNIENNIFISPFESHPNKLLKSVISLIGKMNGKTADYENYSKIIRKYKKNQYSNADMSTYKEKENNEFDFIMHTGGTTGVHKGVEITGKAFNNTVTEHNALMDGTVFRGDKLVNPMPQFITYGMTTMHLTLCKGFEMVMLLIPTPKSFTNSILKNKAKLAYGGPVHWEGFAKAKKAKKADLSFLKVAVAGGEKINITTKEELNKFFADRNCNNVLIDGYGLSEVTGVFSVALNENTIGTQGQPLAHNNAGIFDRENNCELQIGQVGELYVSSESMMNRYHENEDETNKVMFNDNGMPKMKTGDAASINELGELNIVGRYKRIFVCGVDKVYQERMEEIVCELPFVEKCVITRIPVYDENLKAVPKAHIVLKDEYKQSMSQKEVEKLIQIHVAKTISDKVIPRYFEFQTSVKYTPNGKIDFSLMTKEDQISLNQLYPNIVRPFMEVDQYASSVNNISNHQNEIEDNIKRGR